MRMQKRISLELNKKRVGSVCEVLIESVSSRHGRGFALARSYAEAPDVDGMIKLLPADGTAFSTPLHPGDYVFARITKAYEYDLEAVLIDKEAEK